MAAVELPEMRRMAEALNGTRKYGVIRVEIDAVPDIHPEPAIFLSMQSINNAYAYLTIAEAKELIHELCAVVAATIMKPQQS